MRQRAGFDDGPRQKPDGVVLWPQDRRSPVRPGLSHEAALQRRQQPGPYQRGLATAGGAHHGQKAPDQVNVQVAREETVDGDGLQFCSAEEQERGPCGREAMGLRPAQEESGMAAESQGFRAERPTYTSPQRKLVAFFAQSRDQWKAKCRGAKARLKQLKKKVQRGAVRQYRQHERLQALASEVGRLQAENHQLVEALRAREKKER
jgi:hypothetical protein